MKRSSVLAAAGSDVGAQAPWQYRRHQPDPAAFIRAAALLPVATQQHQMPDTCLRHVYAVKIFY
ncbi:MAG: hypothetical protein MJE12_13850 [Alphaproteobacteria bacterium]|nr:hypothetical protein [Alphaproteobacteria bacterium]